MDHEIKRLCTICARGGSKGVPNKNLHPLLGKPLIAYSIEQAVASGLFGAIAVSSDSDDILTVAAHYGADYLVRRPPDLASDTAPKLPAIRHCALEAERMAGCQYDVFVDLDATSPLRLPEDIAGAILLLEVRAVSNVITGAPSRRSPYFNLIELDAAGVARLSKPLPAPIARRQDAPRCYDMNASIYVWQRRTLLDSDALFQRDTLLFEMPEERSVDIDSVLDLHIVELILKERAARA